MSRKIYLHNDIISKDILYKNILINLLINKILKCGKKRLAEKIVYQALNLIKYKTQSNPLIIFEKAIRNISPQIQLKIQQIDKTTRQVPVLLSKFKSTNVAICWIVHFSKKRSEHGMILKLANEILDAAKGTGNAMRKKDETHKMIKANKTFIRF